MVVSQRSASRRRQKSTPAMATLLATLLAATAQNAPASIAASTPVTVDSTRWEAHLSREIAECRRAAATAPVQSQTQGPPPPKFPATWSAECNQSSSTTMGTKGTAPGQYAEDKSKPMAVSASFGKAAFAAKAFIGTPAEWFNMTQVMGANWGGFIQNGQNLFDNTHQIKYNGGMFDWLAGSTFMGSGRRNGVPVNTYALNVSTPSVTGTMQADFTPEGAPIWFRQDFKGPSLPGGMYWTETAFLAYTAGGTLPAMSLTRADFEPTPPCYDGKTPPTQPEMVDMYIFHPKNQFNISGQNTGDITGDANFVCVDLLTGQSPMIDHAYAWITHWQVQVWPEFGQYAACNDYPPICWGSENHYVGREAAMAMGYPKCAQCSPSNLTVVGSWWSMSAGGECVEGQSLGPKPTDCTWKIAKKVKTIDSNCLFTTLNFKESCEADLTAPFAKAVTVFTKAFAEGSANGGCDPISP